MAAWLVWLVERAVRKTHSHWGTYHLKLWSGQEKKWETLVIDDFVPTKHGAPLFTKPHGNEMWVLLLEKAFAKLVRLSTGFSSSRSTGFPLKISSLKSTWLLVLEPPFPPPSTFVPRSAVTRR